MADVTSIYGNPIKDADARADISTLQTDVQDVKDGLFAAFVTDTASGAIASFPDGADGVPVKSLTVDAESGHTQAVVTLTGFNVWDEEWQNGRWAGNNGVLNPAFTSYVACKNKIPVKPNTTYYFIIDDDVSKKSRELVYYDINGDWLSDAPSIYQDKAFTTPDGCYYITFNLAGTYGATYHDNVSINYPSTDHNYHAYNGQQYIIDLNGGSTETDITTIKGQNNIWSDTGDVEVEYRADTKLYINKVLNA